MMSDLIDQKSESEESCCEDSIDRILSLRPKIIAKRRFQGPSSNLPAKTDSVDDGIFEVL